MFIQNRFWETLKVSNYKATATEPGRNEKPGMSYKQF